MKKTLLIVLLSVIAIPSSAVIRVKFIDPAASKLHIQNFVNFTYDYSQFQLSIGSNYYTLSALQHSGNLNMTALAYVYFSSVTIPPFAANGPEALAGTSIAIWYPNSLPGNATVGNLVDFLQYGSAGNPYEAVAVSAGKWTAGDFINVAPPYQFNGAITDYGSSFFSSATAVPVITVPVKQLLVAPNPVTSTVALYIPKDFNGSKLPVELTIFNANGSAVLTTVKEALEVYLINCTELPAGIYTVQIKDNAADILKSGFIKKDD